MSTITPGQLAARSVPVAAALVAAALFVAVVPSKSSDGGTVRTGAFELPEVDGTDAASPSFASPTGASGAQPTGSSAAPSAEGSGSGGGDAATGVVAGDGGGGGQAAAAPGFDCTRKDAIGGPTCRPPAWTGGDNGGTTAHGVTDEVINIVTYVPKRNPQVQAILAAAGTASTAQQTEVLTRYEKYFNEHFELYGRKVKLIFQEGPGDGADPAANQADAATVATDLNAFYVNCPACAASFHDELIRRGIPSTSVIVPFLNEYHERSAPYLYGVLPDFDLTAASGAEYYCKRLAGRNAVHAGDATLAAQPRKLAIVAIDTPDNAGDRYKAAIEACGGEVALLVKYAGDITTAQQQATNIALQIRQSGANVVTCVCDVIAPVFMTAAATEQQYFPEWFSNGLFALDSYKAAQLYDQQQWSHAFGIGSISKPLPLDESPYYVAYKEGGGTDEVAIENAGGANFSGIMQALFAIELAGPNLTVDAFTNAMLTMPAFGDERVGGSHQSFGRNGPGPWTRVDDHGEIWWDPQRQADNDRLGDYFYVDSGRRYLVGAWPTTDPNVFVDDGGEQ
jgi:hypothetical protein